MIRLLIEAGVLETRVAVIEQGIAVAFHVYDETRRPLLGWRTEGRITGDLPALGACLVDLGRGRTGFLKRKDGPKGLTVGTQLLVEVIREPMGDKAARLTACPSELGPAPPPPPAVALARRLGVDTIALDGPGAAALRPWLAGVRIERPTGLPPLFIREDVEEAFAAALDPVVPLAPSGRLTIDEVEALTAIDIDSGNPADPAALAITAAETAAAEIRRRNLGGQIVIDFPAFSPDVFTKARHALGAALRLDPMQPQLLRGDLDGLVAVTRSRLGASLWRAVSEPCPVSTGRWLGRRHLAARLIRACDATAQASPGRRLAARIPADVLAWLEQRPAGFHDWAGNLGSALRIEAGDPATRTVEVTAL